MIQDIFSAIPIGFILSIMPGAVFFVLLETSVLKGFKAAIAFDMGAISSDIVFILIAYFSSYKLLEKIKDEPALFIFGGLVLLTYGIISLVKVKKTSRTALINDAGKDIVKKNYLNLFIKGFLLNFINIGVLGFWLTIIIAWGPKLDLEPSRMLVFFIAIVSTYFIIDLGKIALAKQLRSKLTTKNIMKMKQIISVILMIFGVALLLQGWFPSKMEETINQIEHSNQ
ncbi:LysE family translocator [Flavobacterium psychrotrophum]|uniref:LysE family translocator n=1 Tax=Flavobacterium psychrotrophum TaxID=2294119 RepID=UPI000E30FF4D|nr:LysE family transporter [Flavobacterium psychrotrophum]